MKHRIKKVKDNWGADNNETLYRDELTGRYFHSSNLIVQSIIDKLNSNNIGETIEIEIKTDEND